MQPVNKTKPYMKKMSTQEKVSCHELTEHTNYRNADWLLDHKAAEQYYCMQKDGTVDRLGRHSKC
jgi:hypothetical protein